jgi:Ser/Thr protein kinase RdoA (MazF antagonist)
LLNEFNAVNKVKFLNRNPPTFSEDQVRRIATSTFGLEGEFKSLASERDQNFCITTTNGERFVFKISNHNEDPGVVDLQIKALQHIELTDPALKVPHIRP